MPVTHGDPCGWILRWSRSSALGRATKRAEVFWTGSRGVRHKLLAGARDINAGPIRLRTLTFVLSGIGPLLAGACTSFATVRSAEVLPGASVAVQGSASTQPGDAAAWFWSFDCADACNHPVIGGDMGVTYGWLPGGGARAFTVGVGTNGTHPYVDGYVQLGAGRQPFGLGARIGPPVTDWREHQIYGRYDVRVGGTTRLLLNPALFVHEGRSPNGENPGSFLGFVQGIGLLLEGERVSWTPAVALVAGRARRTSYGQQVGPVRSVFGAASLGVTFHRSRGR